MKKLIPRNKKGGSSKNWIQDAVNPAHKGYCTPISKSTCTKKRKALAKTFKKMAKHEIGGSIDFLMPLIEQFKKGGTLTKDYIKKAHNKPGGSNVGKKTFADGSKRTGPYAGPSDGAPKESYPIPDLKHAKSAIKLSGHAPNPSGIKQAVYKKYPQLKHQQGGTVIKTKSPDNPIVIDYFKNNPDQLVKFASQMKTEPNVAFKRITDSVNGPFHEEADKFITNSNSIIKPVVKPIFADSLDYIDPSSKIIRRTNSLDFINKYKPIINNYTKQGYDSSHALKKVYDLVDAHFLGKSKFTI